MVLWAPIKGEQFIARMAFKTPHTLEGKGTLRIKRV